MAAIARPTLLFMINQLRAPNLCINLQFNFGLRDFSLLARIGELAQAVSYCYWHWHGGYPNISDFNSWAISNGFVIPSGVQTPDYVMSNHTNLKFALMEAKGTQSNDHRQSISAALRQCRAGFGYTPIKRGYGCVLTLDTQGGGGGGSGVLHLRDPDDHSDISLTQAHELFRHSYASWFDLWGNLEMADWCRAPLAKAGKMQLETLLETSGTMYLQDPLPHIILESLGFNPDEVRFEIQPMIARALSYYEAYKDMNLKNVRVSNAEDSEKPGSAIYFPDGTAIIPA
jgi:hypothetical protein